MSRNLNLLPAIGACIGWALLAPAVHAASLRTITDVWGGRGNGNIPQGCTVFSPIPALGSFFNDGGLVVQGGNVACGYVGETADLTAASGPLLSQQTLAPVPLDNVGSSFQGAAGARASYGSLGVSASGVQVGTSSATSATYSTSAAFFQDQLTASSPLIAPSAPGFVRYVFRMDGSLLAPTGQGGGASVKLSLQQAGGPIYDLGRLQVQAGDPATFSAIDGSPAGWALGVGSISGSGTFGSTVHVPFFGDVDLPMNWGSPWDLTVGLLAQSQHTANASFMATAQLVDVQLFDAAHQRTNDFSLSAASGTNYLAPVPEPASGALAVVGLLAVGGWARRRRVAAAAATAASMLPLLAATPARADVSFVVTNLGTLGGNSSEAFAINASGQVAGRAYLLNGTAHATRWTGGLAQDLGTLGGSYSNAYGINDAGQVAGDSYLADNVRFRGVLWNASGMPTALAEVGGLNHQATGINANSSVVGYTTDSGGFTAPIVWRNGGFVQLDAPTTANYTRATGINSAGRIVGGFGGVTSGAMTWVSESAGYQTLADLGGGSGAARAVNSAGVIVGYSYDARSVQQAAVWEGGVVRGLGTLGGFASAEALAVNDRGQIVGWSPAGGPSQRGLYYGSGSMVDINTMLATGSGATITAARGINNSGQVAGTALIGGQTRAVLLTPTGSVAWQAGGNGSFADAARWEQGFQPSKFLDASITSAGMQTVSLGADASVKNLNLGLPAGSASRPTLQLQGGAILQVAGLFTVNDTGALAGDGAIVGALLNRGSVLPTNITVVGPFDNQGLVTGSGTLNAALDNGTSGQVRSGAGQSLNVLGPGHTNAGTIDISGGGQQHYGGALANAASGRVQLNNAVLRLDDGLVNNGQVQVSFGGASVYGSVATKTGGKVILSGNSQTTFFDAVAVESGGELRVSAGSTAVFFGVVTQRTGALFTGTGTKFYEGGLSVGASPGLGTDAGDVSFGSANLYTAEIGGISACTLACGSDAALRDRSFDKYAVAGRLSFGGTLKLVSWAGFTGQVGQSFDLFDWGSGSGSFSSIDASGLALAPGATLDASQLYSTGVISVTAVPEPGVWTLLLCGLGVVALRTRRSA